MTENSEPRQFTDADETRMAEMRRAGLTLDEIGNAYGVPRTRIFQILEQRMTPGELNAYRTSDLPDNLRVPLEAAENRHAAARPRRKRNLIIAAVAVVVLAGAGIGLALGLSGSSHPTTGYYNMTTLKNSVQSQVNTDPSMPLGATVLSCSMAGKQTATCEIGTLGGQTQGITVLISNDGQSWTQQ